MASDTGSSRNATRLKIFVSTYLPWIVIGVFPFLIVGIAIITNGNEPLILIFMATYAAYSYINVINPLFSITRQSNKNTEPGDSDEQ
ncbi:hypothetical protein NMA58_25045 (plasmid) [Rhizobium sp. YTUHZ045]|uniref:hypothetical protein n=1 Tax=Rhizobium sp. YTUHZ045 TaxID=2962888 RepID=UPI003DA91179